MRLYAALAVFTAVYAVATTFGATADAQALVWNGVVGALLSLALAVSLVPLAGPALYETALNVLASAARPPIELGPLAHFLRAASWGINIAFTVALILYVAKIRRPIARRVIRALLF
ncbi:MAG: hypothetical protein ACP5J0_03570 [Pyrobaculum sp.]